MREQVPEIVLHAFTDGRDTLPTSVARVPGAGGELARRGSRRGVPARRRVRHGALLGDGPRQPLGPHEARLRRARARRGPDARTSAQDAIRQAYGRDETDEFIQPTIVGEPAPLRDGDSVITFNFRPDRMRQIVRALGEPGFDRVRPPRASRAIHLTTMTRYQEDWDYPVAFPEARPETTLAEVLAERGERQLHVAETEKYAHVTYFFNGGEEDPYPGEERCLVPSPRDVADLRPEAGDERGAGGRGVRRPVAGGGGGGAAVPLRDHQLRQPGHGRPHRQHPRGDAGGRDGRPLPRPGARARCWSTAAVRS